MKIYTFNSKIMTLNDKWMEQPSAPPGPAPGPSLPSYTIRLKFTEDVTPSFGSGTAVQVSSSPNIWDLTYESSAWTRLFQNQYDLLEVIDANIIGVTEVSYLFRNCSGLTSVSLFDTSTVTVMFRMFQNCSGLTAIPLFDTSSVTNMDGMFFGCTGLTTIPLFNTSSVTTMGSTFRGCTNVQSGALALYQQVSTQATPPTSHTATFRDCGSNTTTGAAELAQIPDEWK